ncbi:ATP/GTP-binding protein [Acidaminococcus timonensis]|uniref:AAA family ATPase n=1 Tax=Acidaminococcus timonensis TaxID=1871002 RepID=UPI0026F23B27|nr:AAA family ATPase [Acidaminococcus timonensis]
MKLLRIEFERLPIFRNGHFCIDFLATDRVMKDDELYCVDRNVYTEKLLAFVGMNATGKTTVLRLLNFACQVVIANRDLNSLGMDQEDIIQDGTLMQIVFFHNGKYYQLKSEIGIRDKKGVIDGTQEYYFKEESLVSKPKSAVTSKRNVFVFDDTGRNVERLIRSQLNSETKLALKDDASMVILVTRENDSAVANLLATNYLNYSPMMGKTPVEVLNVFDDNIEYLTTVKNKQDTVPHWRLKFKNQDKVYDIDFGVRLNQLVSAGTIKGHALLGNAIAMLHYGGYLFVDELENHFNKELVHMILNLFASAETNPHGACLVFSTHYAEILDFIHRKDNVYINRKENGLLSVSKFADEVHRIEVKKSEIIISNCLTGTAPQYENMQALREAICKVI